MLAIRIPAAGVAVDWSDDRVIHTAFDLLGEMDEGGGAAPKTVFAAG